MREANVAKGTARLSPVHLKTSEQIRLQRLSRTAVYKEDVGQLVVPLARDVNPARALVTLLQELVQTVEAPQPVASAVP